MKKKLITKDVKGKQNAKKLQVIEIKLIQFDSNYTKIVSMEALESMFVGWIAKILTKEVLEYI